MKNTKAGHSAWTEVYEMARLIREGKTKWEDLDLDDIDMRLKWTGLFHRRKATPGRFMLRMRVPNGELNGAQLRALDKAVAKYGEDGHVDITTRQNIQLRGMPLEDADGVIDSLWAVGITCKQTGLDNVRNIVGNPIAGVDPHELIDTRPLCKGVQDMLTNHGKGRAELSNLPRKFNVAFNSTRDNFAHTHINDLGFDAIVDPATGRTGFNVIVGGFFSGQRCDMSIDLNAWVPAEEVVAFTEAMLIVYRDHGSRGNRTKIRLLYFIEEWGVDKFRAAVEAQLGKGPLHPRVVNEAYQAGKWEHRSLAGVHPQKQPGMFFAQATVPAGRLLPSDMSAIADIAERHGDGTVRLTVGQDVIFVNIPEANLAAFLAEPLFQKYKVGTAGPLTSHFVSCTGAQFCPFGLAETKSSLIPLIQSLDAQLRFPEGSHPVRIHVTGCPNSCGQAQVGTIGLVGAPAKVDGKATSGFRVLVGGEIGEQPTLASDFEKAVPVSELEAYLKKLLIDKFHAVAV
eukprot:jgi/Mesvir1/28974/Mv17748-RA.1